ncbi:MAG TPA: FAD-binding oxidoreductase [Dongiaceae bacterium]
MTALPVECDFLVIGAGISGAAAAYELAAHGVTVLLEMEDRPGHHSTGRSASLYTPNYGPKAVRAICQAAYSFFRDPPAGFSDYPLLSPRGALSVAIDDPQGHLDEQLQDHVPEHPISEITPAEACRLCPPLRPGLFRRALFEPGVMDMDAAAIHQGFLRGFKSRGGRLAVAEPVTALERSAGGWTAVTGNGRYHARVVVNAAGAWADRLAAMAGVNPIGLQPRLRTAMVFEAPPEFCGPSQPVVDFTDTEAYFKPEAGRIMASPGDATPSEPMDAYPDDMVVAELADYIERHTLLKIDRVLRSWAGLRSFVADSVPVVGFAPDAQGFFWLAGQGGYGIMMSPVLAQATAGLVAGSAIPPDLRDRGITEDVLGPGRSYEAA